MEVNSLRSWKFLDEPSGKAERKWTIVVSPITFGNTNVQLLQDNRPSADSLSSFLTPIFTSER
jgi:hypothetical protein